MKPSLDRIAGAAADAARHPSRYGMRQWTGWVVGPLLLAITLLVPAPEGLSDQGWRTAGVALLMAVWWICESVPIPVTALLPLVVFPALGLSDMREATAPFSNPVLYLFLGGFVIALAMQKWGLHRRVAVLLIGAIGTRPDRIVLGFLLSSALISMWVSNTATALMMLPIALSVTALACRDAKGTQPPIVAAVLLAVAYGATTGGMATLIGTPPNALLAGYVEKVMGVQLGFGRWMMLGVPVMLVTLPCVYFVLTRVSFRLGDRKIPGLRELIQSERSTLGPMGYGERAVAAVFFLTALGWVLQPVLASQVPMITDTTIAMTGALVLFMIPVSLRRGEFVMDWESAKGLPWDVLLLFGGGLSLAGNIERHGLSKWLGDLASGLDALPTLAVLCVFCFGILMLTELTSNTATAATFLPIAGAIAASLGAAPLVFLVPCALAANCSYMLPVGTPPNAIVFGSGQVTLPQMARAGMLLNLLLVPIIVGICWLLAPMLWPMSSP